MKQMWILSLRIFPIVRGRVMENRERQKMLRVAQRQAVLREGRPEKMELPVGADPGEGPCRMKRSSGGGSRTVQAGEQPGQSGAHAVTGTRKAPPSFPWRDGVSDRMQVAAGGLGCPGREGCARRVRAGLGGWGAGPALGLCGTALRQHLSLRLRRPAAASGPPAPALSWGTSASSVAGGSSTLRGRCAPRVPRPHPERLPAAGSEASGPPPSPPPGLPPAPAAEAAEQNATTKSSSKL